MTGREAGRGRGGEQDGARRSLGRLGDFIGFRLRRVQNQLSRDFAAATTGQGLRSGQFSSLAIISANPGISQTELSDEVGLDKSVTVTIIDELEKYGWAVRERSTEDRRRYALYITPRGEERLNELFAKLEKTENAVLHQLSAAELRVLSDLLDRMYAACAHAEAPAANAKGAAKE